MHLFAQCVANFIVKLVTPWMKVSERRITTVPLKKHVVVCLFHLRNMCTATTTGRIFGISNQLVSKLVNQFCKVVSSNVFVTTFINFPNINEARVLAKENIDYGGIPGAILQVDGCEIPWAR